MYKVVSLFKRRSSLEVLKFQEQVSSRYGPLFAASPWLRCYVQSLPLPQGYGKAELLFDAVAEMWFDGPEDYLSFLQAPAYAKLEAAQAEVFDAARTVVMPVEVVVIKAGAIPPGAVKNIEFVNRRPATDVASFHAYWRDVHGPLAARIPVLLRYEQNHLQSSAYAGALSPAYDGLAVTWFASTADMRRGATTPEYAATRADEPNFLADGHLPVIITREHVLKDERDLLSGAP